VYEILFKHNQGGKYSVEKTETNKKKCSCSYMLFILSFSTELNQKTEYFEVTPQWCISTIPLFYNNILDEYLQRLEIYVFKWTIE